MQPAFTAAFKASGVRIVHEASVMPPRSTLRLRDLLLLSLN